MRFDELILTMADDELRVRFHPELTVLSGLDAAERRGLADRIVDAVAGASEHAALHYLDATGRATTLATDGGAPRARHDDGTEAPLPVALTDGAALRATMLLGPDDLGETRRPPRPHDPPELQEARANLEALNAELDAARDQERQETALQSELAELDNQLRAARDGASRRAYAQVLATLERVRAEMATLEGGTAGVEGDRHLLAGAEDTRRSIARWQEATAHADELAGLLEGDRPLDDEGRAALALVPSDVSAALHELVETLLRAIHERDQLEQRLQVLAVATLPAPSHLVVGELGLLDQTRLWHIASSLQRAGDDLDEVRISLGGLGTDDGGPDPAVIAELEAAHRALDEAERGAEAVRITGVAGAGLGVAIAAAGAIGGFPIPMVLGIVAAIAVGLVTLVMPKAKVARAAAVEQTALAEAGAASYLGFHLRRVEASVDPAVRDRVDAILVEHRRAHAEWVELVGPDVDVLTVSDFEAEIRAYHDALRSLGGAADEIEQLRRELADRAVPAVAEAWGAVTSECAPLGLGLSDADDPHQIEARAAERVELGRRARAEEEVDAATAVAADAAEALEGRLLQLGFGTGELPARIGALEWAITRAQEREEARTNARPLDEVRADLERLDTEAARLRQPEWSTVTAADAEAPPIEELEERRAKVVAELERGRPNVDVARLADRQAALERRVSSLAARLDHDEGVGDAGAVADVQQRLLAHLTSASTAGRHGDPVPVVLDEVLSRVAADRRWDLLDLLLRLSERHQLIYLTDDAFVAAWARQQSATGAIMLLEASPEVV